MKKHILFAVGLIMFIVMTIGGCSSQKPPVNVDTKDTKQIDENISKLAPSQTVMYLFAQKAWTDKATYKKLADLDSQYPDKQYESVNEANIAYKEQSNKVKQIMEDEYKELLLDDAYLGLAEKYLPLYQQWVFDSGIIKAQSGGREVKECKLIDIQIDEPEYYKWDIPKYRVNYRYIIGITYKDGMEEVWVGAFESPGQVTETENQWIILKVPSGYTLAPASKNIPYNQ